MCRCACTIVFRVSFLEVVLIICTLESTICESKFCFICKPVFLGCKSNAFIHVLKIGQNICYGKGKVPALRSVVTSETRL